MMLRFGSGRRKEKALFSLPSIARLNTKMNQVFRPFEPETRVQIPAGAPNFWLVLSLFQQKKLD